MDGQEYYNGYFNSDTVQLNLLATDATSGVEKTNYILNGQADTYYTPLIISRQGNYNLSWWSEDKAGNIEEETSFNIMIDRDRPYARLYRDIYPDLESLPLPAGTDYLEAEKYSTH